jgi:hypothetical protein
MPQSESLPTLPLSNAMGYPGVLTEVTQASIREVMLHYAHGPSTSARHHLIAAGLEIMGRVSSLKDVGLRRVIERAGYGFSRFYSIWPNLETYHFDVWRFGLKCYSLSEIEHLRQLGSESPDAFANVLARHSVLAQHFVSPLVFKKLMNEHANGSMMDMLSHIPEHINATHSMFLLLFPQLTQNLPLAKLEPFAWMAGIYLFTRSMDEAHNISDDQAIALLRDLLMSIWSEPNSA